MVTKTVYLAGPISGLTYDEATGWRDIAQEELAKSGIKAISPLSAAVHLRNHKGLLTDCEIVPGLECVVQAMSTPTGVVTRDKFYCLNTDVMILNLLGSKRVSIGSMVEVGWANARNIPIVLVMEENHASLVMQEKRGWLAGIIDGEGCINISKIKLKSNNYSYQLRLSVAMKDRHVIEYIHKITGVGTITPQRRKKYNKTPGDRDLTVWRVVGQQAAQILEEIYPLLIEKQTRAAIAAELAHCVRGNQRQNMPDKGQQGFRCRSQEELTQVEKIYQRYRATYVNNHDTSLVKYTPASKGNQHEHAFVTECCQFRTTKVSDALHIVKAILGEY